MVPRSYNEALIRCSPVVTMSCNFTFALEFIDFCFTAGFTLSSGKLKLRNSCLSPDPVAPERPLRSLLYIFAELEYANDNASYKMSLCGLSLNGIANIFLQTS